MSSSYVREPDRARFLTPLEVSDLLKVPVKTLYTWRYRRTGPPASRVGRHLRYREDSILKWLREREVVHD